MRAITLFILLSIFSSAASATSNFSITTTIKKVLIYPVPRNSIETQYTELVLSLADDLNPVPNCVGIKNRVIVDSHNPLFPYIYGIVLQAKKENSAVLINYWNVCEASNNHNAALIRSVTLK